MLIFNKVKPNLIPSSCIALGFFDGVHLGHKKVILDAVNKSKRLDSVATVVTFANHPKSVVSSKIPKLLTSLDSRLEIFKELGVQAVLVLDFSAELAAMQADEYLKKILVDTLHPKTISVGYDHHFGAQKSGNSEFLKKHESVYGYEVSVIQPVKLNDKIVSSSLIRKALSLGEVKSAAQYMGRPFSIKNTVIHGEKRGRTIGFPTANLAVPHNVAAPSNGVYAGFADIDGHLYKALINLGKRPTFADLKENLIEAYIVDFDGDIYGREIEILFVEKIREEVKFSSIDELKLQIEKDCLFASEYTYPI